MTHRPEEEPEGGGFTFVSASRRRLIVGGGKRLFEGISKSLDLEHLGVRQSPYATFIDYRVKRA